MKIKQFFVPNNNGQNPLCAAQLVKKKLKGRDRIKLLNFIINLKLLIISSFNIV